MVSAFASGSSSSGSRPSREHRVVSLFMTLYFPIASLQSRVWVPAKLLIGNYC